jgi:tRNA-Thr(GGU) m(6)t(6)A37 methyltransferase TsaA
MESVEATKSSLDMRLQPVGWVRSKMKRAGPLAQGPTRPTLERVQAELVLDERFAEAADGLEEFSHIIVLFWAHADVPTEERCSEEPSPIKLHLMGREDLPLLGVFATRCFDRPNPICATTVRLLERTGRVLRVEGLDAFDGSPIIDIKPYVPYLDSAAEVKMPEWMCRLAQLLGLVGGPPGASAV